MNRRCCDCQGPLTKSLVDHAYCYDHGEPIQLLAIVKWACSCGYYEIEIPRMGPLHRAIEEALNGADVKREALTFRFENGPNGLRDGAWAVSVRQAA